MYFSKEYEKLQRLHQKVVNQRKDFLHQTSAWLIAAFAGLRAPGMKMPTGRILFYPGSACQNYMLVVEGVIRVRLITASGREVLLYQVRPGAPVC